MSIHFFKELIINKILLTSTPNLPEKSSLILEENMRTAFEKATEPSAFRLTVFSPPETKKKIKPAPAEEKLKFCEDFFEKASISLDDCLQKIRQPIESDNLTKIIDIERESHHIHECTKSVTKAALHIFKSLTNNPLTSHELQNTLLSRKTKILVQSALIKIKRAQIFWISDLAQKTNPTTQDQLTILTRNAEAITSLRNTIQDIVNQEGNIEEHLDLAERLLDRARRVKHAMHIRASLDHLDSISHHLDHHHIDSRIRFTSEDSVTST